MAVCLFLSYTPLSGVRGFGAATRLSGSVAARDRVGCAGEYIRTFFPASRDLEYNFGVVFVSIGDDPYSVAMRLNTSMAAAANYMEQASNRMSEMVAALGMSLPSSLLISPSPFVSPLLLAWAPR